MFLRGQASPQDWNNPECKSLRLYFLQCARVRDTISLRGNPHVRAAGVLDCGHGIYFRPLVSQHCWFLAWHHGQRGTARSRDGVLPRWHVRQSTYAQARLSASFLIAHLLLPACCVPAANRCNQAIINMARPPCGARTGARAAQSKPGALETDASRLNGRLHGAWGSIGKEMVNGDARLYCSVGTGPLLASHC
jgi:hypothetical protein